MPVVEVLLPRTSDAMTEAVVSRWLAPSGSAVGAGDPIVEVETDKAIVEVAAAEAGLLVPLADDGARLQTGAVMALILTGEEAAEFERDHQSAVISAHAPDLVPGPKTGKESEAPLRGGGAAADRREADLPEAVSNGAKQLTSADAASRVFSSPLARRMAREARIDIGLLHPGTGPGGRIVRADVARAVAHAEAHSSSPSGELTEIPARQVTMARRMTESQQTIPHFYLLRSVNVSALLKLQADIERQLSVRFTFTSFVLRAVAMAIEDFPAFRTRWSDHGLEDRSDCGIGVAVALEGVDLAVPVVAGEALGSLRALTARVAELVEAAKQGRLSLAETSGACVTVSNLGMYGVDELYPIVPPGQAAIIGVGRTVPELRLGSEGEVLTTQTLKLSMAADHRLVSGALGARFLTHVAAALESPLRLLT